MLNDVWGSGCYEKWDEVEHAAAISACVTDFIDWREFHLDTMTARSEMAARHRPQEADPKNVAYLHVVPNTMTMFNSVMCVDDFDIAPMCDVWAASMNQNPTSTRRRSHRRARGERFRTTLRAT